MKMQYREAVLTDAKDIAELAAKMWTSHTVKELAEGFAAAINDPGCAVFLMNDGDKAVGFAQCGLRHDYVEGTESSPVGYLEGISEDRTGGICRKCCRSSICCCDDPELCASEEYGSDTPLRQ